MNGSGRSTVCHRNLSSSAEPCDEFHPPQGAHRLHGPRLRRGQPGNRRADRRERFVEKLLRIERIQSISEKYLLVSASHGRVAYWEYEGGLTALRRRLEQAGLLLGERAVARPPSLPSAPG